MELPAGLRGFLDRLLGLLLGADEQHLSALRDGVEKELAGILELHDGLAQVDDVDAVAGIENEGLHLRVPATGLVTEMHACFEELFNADIGFQSVSCVAIRPYLVRTIPGKTGFMSVVVVATAPLRDRMFKTVHP